jgi:hypothetical protein
MPNTFGVINIAPPTFEDPFVEENGRLSSEAFNYFMTILLPRIGQTASIFGTAPVLEQEGIDDALATTPLPMGTLSTGIYRVNVYVRVTTPDGVGSSVQPFVQFIDDGVTCTMDGPALTADAIDAPLSTTFLVSVDQPGPISFGTNYSSTTPNLMQYKAVVSVERLQ